MSNPTVVLTLSLYPPDNPTYGGQHRLFNIVKKFESCGCKVYSAGVTMNVYETDSRFYKINDYQYPPYLKPATNMENYAVFDLLSKDQLLRQKLVHKLTCVPDIIHVEQPWMMPLAVEIKSKLNPDVVIIYGSANIEYQLKGALLKDKFDSEYVSSCVNAVKESELYSIKNADYILAVTQYDQHWISQHTNKPVLLAPNGVRGSDDATSGDLLVPKEIKYALFAASAYLPNLTGFYEIFKNGIGCIAPDQRLVIVGSCCRHFQHDPMFSNITNLKERSMFLGVIDDDALRLVIKNAHTIILPILTGGGSNLKTAEAIQAGCYVVSTSKAMHGFEQFKKSCGIFITDDPSQFQRDVRKSLSLKKLQLDENEKAARSILLWTNSLHELETIVSSIRNH